jgi:hypothetical protein
MTNQSPKAGDNFQVGSNYSGTQGKIAQVLGTERTASGEILHTVVDSYGNTQIVKENNNASAKAGFFSSNK